jgi:hypothetical protein
MIMTVPLVVECQQDGIACTIYIFVLTGDHMAVTGL